VISFCQSVLLKWWWWYIWTLTPYPALHRRTEHRKTKTKRTKSCCFRWIWNWVACHCCVNRDLRAYDDGRGETVYRLDRCEMYNSMAASMSSLLRLMENSPVWFVKFIIWKKYQIFFVNTLFHICGSIIFAVFNFLNDVYCMFFPVSCTESYVIRCEHCHCSKTSWDNNSLLNGYELLSEKFILELY